MTVVPFIAALVTYLLYRCVQWRIMEKEAREQWENIMRFGRDQERIRKVQEKANKGKP